MTDTNSGFGEYNVVGMFPDMEAARKVVAALENRGIDASHISLLGSQVAEAISQEDTAHRDERIMDEQAGSAAGGIAAGGAIGGTAGFLAGLAAFGIPGAGPVIAGGIWALSLGGAAAGAGVGLAATGYARIKQSEAWELTYDKVSSGSVAVGVHSPDKTDVDTGADVLSSEGGSDIRRYDREGNQVSA